MHIQKIKIKNYRNFSDFEMNFQDGLNVIVGPNNAGKTNLLRAISLIHNPDSITINDFNKNKIKSNFSNEYRKKAPEIELEYEVYHKISEENTDDESILKLLYFLGLDEITKQRNNLADNPEDSNVQTEYSLIANINIKFTLNPKFIEAYLHEVVDIQDVQEFHEVLERYMKHYTWVFKNGITNFKADKKDVVNIFEIDFIEADRNTEVVYKETRKAINEYLNDKENATATQIMKKDISETMEQSIAEVMNRINDVVEEERNDIGLKKGNIAIEQYLLSNVSVPDAYQIQVKDTKSDFYIPLTHNGVGYNNLINMYMLIKLNELRTKDEFRILCLEEPEAHLHPAMQYKLFSYLKSHNESNKLNQQIFVTTHSSNITAVAGLDNMYMLHYERELNNGEEANVISRSVKTQLADEENAKKHLMKFLDVTRSDMLFADKVILVEGIAEKILLPAMMEKLNNAYEDEHISIVEIGGKHFDHFLKLYANNPIHKRVLCITDSDYDFTDENGALQKIDYYKNAADSDVQKLKKEFTADENIRIVNQTSLGRTFEDELFLANFREEGNITKMLEIVLSKSYGQFIKDNGVDYDKWNSNIDELDGRSKKVVIPLKNLIDEAIEKFPKYTNEYKKIFFSRLFLHYANGKKGEVALSILTEESLIEKIIVPEYIEEGLNWLLN